MQVTNNAKVALYVTQLGDLPSPNGGNSGYYMFLQVVSGQLYNNASLPNNNSSAFTLTNRDITDGYIRYGDEVLLRYQSTTPQLVSTGNGDIYSVNMTNGTGTLFRISSSSAKTGIVNFQDSILLESVEYPNHYLIYSTAWGSGIVSGPALVVPPNEYDLFDNVAPQYTIVPVSTVNQEAISNANTTDYWWIYLLVGIIIVIAVILLSGYLLMGRD